MSDETKHTPGPWTADEMVVTAKCPRTEEPATRRFIADCHRLTSTIPADKANARLIAAAPDLLDAARAAREAIISGGWSVNPAWSLVLRSCEAAIDKAEGKS